MSQQEMYSFQQFMNRFSVFKSHIPIEGFPGSLNKYTMTRDSTDFIDRDCKIGAPE